MRTPVALTCELTHGCTCLFHSAGIPLPSPPRHPRHSQPTPSTPRLSLFHTERLDPEASVTVSMGVDFKDSTQAANFQLW